MKIKRITVVIPVTQIKKSIKKPSDHKFQNRSEQSSFYEYCDWVVFYFQEKRRGGSGGDIFFGMMKKAVKYHCADAINGKPWTVKKSAIAKGTVLYKKDENFPEKSAKTSEKEKVDKQGNYILYGVLLRCAEL